MNYNELEGTELYRAVKTWLSNNPGKDLGDFRKETGYSGPELQIKDKKTGRVGLRTRSTDVVREQRIQAQDQEYIKTLEEMGYSNQEAQERLTQSKAKVKSIRSQVTELNREFGKGSFTVGHLTAVEKSGGDFGRNVKLEIGKSKGEVRGNFSRSNVDEIPQNIKAALGIPSNGREAAIMDESGMFDLPLTPKDRQEIIRNPELANDIIGRRIQDVERGVTLDFSGGTAKTKRVYPSRAQMTALAGVGVAALGPLGTAASAAELAGRTQMAQESGNPLDYLQAGIAGVSGAADLASYAPPAAPIAEAVSTTADVANMGIDAVRDFAENVDVGNELEYMKKKIMSGKIPYLQ